MLSIRVIVLSAFSFSNIAIAAVVPSAPPLEQLQDEREDCPVCLTEPSSHQMMCDNGHSMGCESCVQAILAKAAADGVEPRCPLCRKVFNIDRVRENSSRIPQPQQSQVVPVVIDREQIRQQVIEQERHYVLRELGEEGRQRIRAEHLAAIRQAIRNSVTVQEVSEAQEQERREIVREVRAGLKRQEENVIRQQQRALVQAGEIVLIDAAERSSIEQNEFHRMQDEERGHIRRARRDQIRSEGIQLISDAERENIMQNVLEQMQQEERERKARALVSRKNSIASNFWFRNGLIWMSNCLPFVKMGYYNYESDVEQELRRQEEHDPA